MQELDIVWIGTTAFAAGALLAGGAAYALLRRAGRSLTPQSRPCDREEVQHRFDRVRELARVGYWSCEPGYDKELYSEGVARLLGLELDEALRTGSGFQGYVHPEDRDHLVATRENAAINKLSYETRYRIRRADGETRHVEEHGVFVEGTAGQVGRIEGSLQDITELKELEDARQASNRQLQSFIEHTPLTIVFKDCQGRCVLANSSWHKTYNPEGANVVGRVLTDLLPGSLAKILVEQDNLVIEEGRLVEREVSVPQSDGRDKIVLLQKFPVRGSDGEIIGIGAIGTDLTENYRAHEALRLAKESAEIANRAKSEFLANMSHELRTPLNAVIGFSEILQNQLFGPIEQQQYQEYIDDINTSARHLLEILNDILDMSKVESGEYLLDDEVFPCRDELSRCLRLIREKAVRNGLAVSLVEQEAGLLLRADRRVFKQVMLNLLSNAVKFTHEGGQITVSVARTGEGGLEIDVSDTGIGIAPEDINRVLQPFGQADSSLSRKVEGTGLGLSLVQRFMQLHGGDLVLESEPNKGTTARVTFPFDRVSYNSPDSKTVTPTAEAAL
ncbi:PAS domain-containing sensor histidine kinase [Aestuariispira ectoiniformans]|uniref:PAS domain-containing sensor histidine kinase n=1 Tax=Aestuariispira ectoiniformans TaxID=2775080 RepID=UPI00223C0FCA|nr:ATP-binding protein [Aestuariispira ectoiniformans]